jgi:hypothetical protein
MKLSQELQDFIIFIAFNFKVGVKYTENNYEYIKSSFEGDVVYDFFKNYALLFTKSKDKDPVDTDLIKVHQWIINNEILIITCFYNHQLIECFVYYQFKSIKKSYSRVLVGNYSFKKSVKFYVKNKSNNPQIISPAEYSSNPAHNFTIALFYTLDPGLFSPRWETIAKKILDIR